VVGCSRVHDPMTVDGCHTTGKQLSVSSDFDGNRSSVLLQTDSSVLPVLFHPCHIISYVAIATDG
jgi:hypothetical protein